MNLPERMKRFNTRWSITPSASYQEEWEKFRTRAFNALKGVDDALTPNSITTFCQYFGVKETWQSGYPDIRYSLNVIDYLKNQKDEKQFYKVLEAIFSMDFRVNNNQYGYYENSRTSFFSRVKQAVEFSNVNLAVTVNDGDYIFYPKGEEALDNELVELPLSFLDEKSSQHFVQALKFYEQRNSKDSIKSAESLRRSLEEFLRFKLKNQAGLNSNISEVQKQLKIDGRDPQVRNIIFQVFSYLDQYFNENSKHNDGDINEAENEFLIYQTGLLMRYIDQSLGK